MQFFSDWFFFERRYENKSKLIKIKPLLIPGQNETDMDIKIIQITPQDCIFSISFPRSGDGRSDVDGTDAKQE